MTKAQALGDLYGPSKDALSSSKPLFKVSEEAPLRLTSEQQVQVLALLRFKILTPAHFKTIFGAEELRRVSISCQSYETDFVDINKNVPFIGKIEDAAAKIRIAPAFTRLEEISQ